MGSVGDVPGNFREECTDTVPEWQKRNLVALTLAAALFYIMRLVIVMIDG